MRDIILDKEMGINARLTNERCVICLKEVSESILLLGRMNYKAYCPNCGRNIIISKRATKCPNCKEHIDVNSREKLSYGEKIPVGFTICKKCREKIEKASGSKLENTIILVCAENVNGGISFFGSYSVLVRNRRTLERFKNYLINNQFCFVDREAYSDNGVTR